MIGDDQDSFDVLIGGGDFVTVQEDVVDDVLHVGELDAALGWDVDDLEFGAGVDVEGVWAGSVEASRWEMWFGTILGVFR